MTQVLPKKAVREYVWTLLGSFLWGKNLNEKFHIWTGCHAKDSKVIMYDGTIKMVQDIIGLININQQIKEVERNKIKPNK